MTPSTLLRPIVFCALLLATLTASAGNVSVDADAKDAYFLLDLAKASDLSTLPTPNDRWHPFAAQSLRPWLELDGRHEAYFSGSTNSFDDLRIHLRAAAGRDLGGTLHLPTSEGYRAIPFHASAGLASAEHEAIFQRAKYRYYLDRLATGGAGAAWFRHQLNEAREALGDDFDLPPVRNRRRRDVQSTYDFLTGGRALAENIQLDRVLAVGSEDGTGAEGVEISQIEGIEVPGFDWKPLVEGLEPAKDPLAALIPHDQHAVFFPSYRALDRLLSEGTRYGALFAGLVETHSGDTHVLDRYETQLVLPRDAMARLFGERLIQSMAITGSDPYLRTGSDVAVVFETKGGGALAGLLQARWTSVEDAQLSSVKGRIGDGDTGVEYRGLRTPDRRRSAYIAALGGAVVVTNSVAQLEQLHAVHVGRVDSLETTPEYTFFRHRYGAGAAEDHAFVCVSDATIRRWVSPRWRIAASRRIRAAAVLADLQAEHLREIWSDGVQVREIHSGAGIAGGGSIHLRPGGVQSEVYGNLAFITPVRELEVDRVSAEEARAYRVFRDSYQRRWRVFDPIGLRLDLAEDELAFDLTVMPLIGGSDYREMVAFTEGAELRPDDGHRDPSHLFHTIIGIDSNSEQMRSMGNFLGSMSPDGPRMNPLGWIGRYAEFWIESDEAWEAEVAESGERFGEEQFFRTPMVAAVAVKNPLILTGFLTMIRGLAMGAAPGAVRWETIENDGVPYVKVSNPREGGDSGDEFAICYATARDHLILSPREDILKKTLARLRSSTAGAKNGEARPASSSEKDAVGESGDTAGWIGRHFGVEITRPALRVIDSLYRVGFLREAQRTSWSNLEILNEWRRLYPEVDAARIHEELWQVHLRCPSGAEYVWNEADHTFESPVYGHPQAPKEAEAFLQVFEGFERGTFGLTFENDGLRARVRLER